MPRHSRRHSAPLPLRGGPDPRRACLLALLGVVVCALALPLAVASARPPDDRDRAVVRPSPREDAESSSDQPTRSPLLLGPGLDTAARCGPELTSPDGVEAQTCVLVRGEDTWARTYYRNATGADLDSVLSLMGPGGHTVQMRCAVGADDEPGTCETPRDRMRGTLEAYTAFAEFAAQAGRGPLLLRSGSNSEAATGS